MERVLWTSQTVIDMTVSLETTNSMERLFGLVLQTKLRDKVNGLTVKESHGLVNQSDVRSSPMVKSTTTDLTIQKPVLSTLKVENFTKVASGTEHFSQIELLANLFKLQ